MNLENVGIYLSRARIVDLSKKVSPGKAEGPLDTGKRRYEIKSFTFPPGELMHYIDMESHISTHVEAPSHYVPVRHGREAEDISQLSLNKFFGLATFVNCKNLGPRTPIGPEVLRKFPLHEHDILLVGNGSHKGPDRSRMIKEGLEYLVAKKVKMVGFDDTIFVENPELLPRVLKTYFTHDLLLTNGIPVIEGLANLGELTNPRCLFFGFPAKMGGLESFPIRAVALEEG